MAVFDLRTFTELMGQGNSPVTALGTAFGFPSCLLNLSQEVMKLLPSSILRQMKTDSLAGKRYADAVTKRLVRWILLDTGIIEFDTEEGVFKVVSDSSRFGMDENESGLMADIGGFIGALTGAAAFGGRLYNNYQNALAQIEGVKDCLDKYKTSKEFSGGNAVYVRNGLDADEFKKLLDSKYKVQKSQYDYSKEFSDKVTQFVSYADYVLEQRNRDATLEPCFTGDYKTLLEGTSFCVTKDKKEEEKEYFRLVYSPPKSKTGQFLLSRDGLYFDSQSEGIQPVLVYVYGKRAQLPKALKWKFDYDPNLGGRGEQISKDSLQYFTNTIFDPNIIDDSKFIKTYYDEDHCLQVLIGQKNKRVLDLSGQIVKYDNDPGKSSAVLYNLKQQLISENALFQDKINRRKKQIEVAVKAPSIYGGEARFTPGNIPINDFSYLGDYSFVVELKKQKALVLDQDDVSGVVLPILPAYVISPEPEKLVSIDHLFIPDAGRGAIVYDGSSVSSTLAPQLSLTDIIVTDSLVASYNLLEATIKVPSSTEFNLVNCAVEDMTNAAQLVSLSSRSVYPSGLGIAYLDGITKNSTTSATLPSSVGNYIKLPDTKEFRDWTYGRKGFTFEAWVYLPNFNDNDLGWGGSTTTSSLTKVLLSCENVGNASSNSAFTGNINRVIPNQSDSFVRGLMIGFSKDKRLTSNLDADYSGNDVSNAVVFIAPTQSVDSCSVVFLNNTKSYNYGCASSTSFYKCSYPVSSLGVSAGFVLLDFVVDPQKNRVSIYCDGNIKATSSIPEVFGLPDYSPVRLPSFFKENSFEYNDTNIPSHAADELRTGPKLNQFFTPWIIGGGYTDGMIGKGGFMGGGIVGGIISGLRGFVGGIKFYSKALDNNEVLKNYNGQRYFYKNVEV